MALVSKNKRIIIESEKQFWDKAITLAKALDKGKTPDMVHELSFRNLETLRRTLTPKRLAIIREIKRRKPASVYELARLMGTDYKNLIKEVNKLKVLGLVEVKEKTAEKRKSSVPMVNFDSFKVEIPV
jgi:predicted transcriptional regulator